MLKSEFEFLIGKEVDNDTFAMYENMYMALPDNIDKQKFISMLNIDAIPESEDAIRRREEKKRLIKNKIAQMNADIKYLDQENERYRIMLKDKDYSEVPEMKNILIYCIMSNNKNIGKLYDELKELSWEVEK